MASKEKKTIPAMSCPATYRIGVSGHLDSIWSDRLAGMTITTSGGKNTHNITVIEGRLADQAALIGILNTLYDLQLPLVSVDCLDCNIFRKKESNP